MGERVAVRPVPTAARVLPFAALVVSATVGLFALVAANLWSKAALSGARQAEAVEVTRAPNVRVLSRHFVDEPLPTSHPSLLLVGNSHTYALPGLHPGEPLRNDPGSTLIDTLAAELTQVSPSRRQAAFVRLSSPNLLPVEMLARVGFVEFRGLVPQVLVVGLTWRNVARDSAVRSEFRPMFAVPGFTAHLRGRLEQIGADPRVMAAFDASIREDASRQKDEENRAWADRFDESLQGTLGPKVPLMGQSAELRARAYRRLSLAIEGVFLGEQAQTHSYEMVPEDLELNRACLAALLRLARENGTRVLLYLAPERDDLPLLMDAAPQEVFNRELEAMAIETGAVLVDARHTVPASYWGFEGDTPDRSHFTEPGHASLAKFLAHQEQAQAVFSALDPR